MTSLLLGLALTTPTTAVGHNPVPQLPPVVVPAFRPIGPPAFRGPMHRPPALTLEQFSRVFRPVPGFHRVWLVHPATGLPVEVCFTLPQGELKDFDVNRRSIEFEFRHGRHRHEVDINFRHNGTVDVKTD